MSEILKEAEKSVIRMQEFDPTTLARESELGTGLNFSQVVSPANKLIGFYKQISIKALGDLPDPILNQIRTQADADFSKFSQILDFVPDQQNPASVRQSFIDQIIAAYDPAFQKLYPFISYSASVSVDFQRMENEARALVQSVKDRADELMSELDKNKEQANQILEDVRKVAAEQGVSQQAIYFKEENEEHTTQAEEWRQITLKAAWALGIYAFLSIFFHKIPWLEPKNTMQAIQLVTSKFLIFGVFSYMLFLSAKNYLNHKHNAIVNKHRQNALMTFKALADAAKVDENKEIILAYASSCIFSPQETGYSKGGGVNSGTNKSIIELMPKAMVKLDGQSG
ncbi:MAG: hypothetical protein C0621_06030 [Desulfuromonas sp.]|nr:MAG: hypothetical protein C0621_06030 [Desulfuromonas sp.]